MKKLILPFIVLIFLYSCSTRGERNQKSLMKWNLHPISDIVDHPYFKKLKAKKTIHPDGSETWVFKDRSRSAVKVNCQTISVQQPCIIYPQFLCMSTFTIDKGLIKNLSQTGICPALKIIKPSL
jgi:hypothetical protein